MSRPLLNKRSVRASQEHDEAYERAKRGAEEDAIKLYKLDFSTWFNTICIYVTLGAIAFLELRHSGRPLALFVIGSSIACHTLLLVLFIHHTLAPATLATASRHRTLGSAFVVLTTVFMLASYVWFTVLLARHAFLPV